MIVFDLCCTNSHVFEIWFGSTQDYEAQKERGLVVCPYCGDAAVEKAVMAPRIAAKGNQQSAPEQAVSLAADGMKELFTAMAALQKQALANSTYVGARFADEARAIHHGEKDERPIHGRATPEETQSLIEEGVAIAPLPFPVVDPREEN